MSDRDPAELRVGLVSADGLARGGLRALIDEFVGIRVTEAGASADALAGEVDLLVLDLGASGEEPIDTIPFDQPLLALVPDEDSGRRAMSAGASGVLLRDGDTHRLRAAIHAAVAGLVVVDDAFVGELLATGRAPEEELEDPLTPREHEALLLLADGLSNRDIGTQLGISERTAKFHLASLYSKLEVHSRTEAVARAVKLGLLRL